ncbi:MAG: 3-oxoacyl-ACP reductase [Planctomycetes bacterium RBG_16_64_10]|nr:MAG: 3-oxoacyl-ACP reductase [Planctomycetes bacterium RBG_16_64_10]
MDLHLKDKVALVTGGARGLGQAICLGLATEGAHVAINYCRARQRAAALADRIRATHGGDAIAVQGDVAEAENVARIFEQSEHRLGPLDILVNNAAVWPRAYVREMTEEDWDRTLAVNLKGAFLTCREAVRRWLAAGRGGRIVNVSSAVAFLGSTTGHAHYAASKAGLVNFTVSLAREVAAQGIYVNAVAPGMMRTEMALDALETNQAGYLQRIPLGRIADPAEVANTVVFMASDRASYTTGATIDASGGMLMR